MTEDDARGARVDQRLTQMKDKVGMSWDVLAERAGVSSSGLRKIRQGVVVPRRITRDGLAFALGVDRSEIDELFGVDDSTPEPEGMTWSDVALARPNHVFGYRVLTAGSGKTAGLVSALLVDVPVQLLAELTEPEIVAVQTKLAEYAVFAVTQTIQERT